MVSAMGHSWRIFAQLNLGYLALQRGDVAQARVLLAASFAIARGDPRRITAWWVAAFASLAAVQGQADRAARLFGAAEALAVWPARLAHRREIARHAAAARAQLGDAAFAAAWAEGQALTLEQAAGEALWIEKV